MSPSVLVGSYIKPSRAPPFHPSPVPGSGKTRLPDWAIGWSLLCCTCRRVAPPGR